MSKTRVVDESLSGAADANSPVKKTGVDDPGSRYRALLVEAANCLNRTLVSDDANLLGQLRAEIRRLRNAVALLGRNLDGELRPQVGDLVCGTLIERRDDDCDWFRIHGEVIAVEELGKLRIRFHTMELMEGDSEAVKAKAISYVTEAFNPTR